MIIEQIYTGCLAQGAYYIESNGEAVVIDPLREVQPYLQRAEKSKAKIKYVLETHFHADFVSGHLDLSKVSGATIVYGPTAEPNFEAYLAQDGEILSVGNIRFKVLHTPGHTMESTCFLLIDEEDKDIALFTGDTLFIGDVGRPDLAQKVALDLTQEKLAALLYDSLHQKIMPLSDDIIVYPAHGAGSACGKNMSKETSDILGNQKKNNYALQNLSKEEFIEKVLDGLLPPPGYFPANVLMNIQGYESFEHVMNQGLQGLDAGAFELLANETHALILDTRDAETFSKGFIPNAINIGIDGSFAPWVGTMIPDIKQQILLVTESGRETEVITRLARVGYDGAIGHLKGGFETWLQAGKEFDTIQRMDAETLAEKVKSNLKIQILDVRKPDEFSSEHLVNAISIPLDYMNDCLSKLDKKQTYYVHCAGGYRSMIFASILKSRGFEHLIDIQGGFQKIKETQRFNLTEYVCPSTL